jgi:hypothetical protein
MTETPTYDLAAARTVLIDGQRWVCISDILSLLGADPSSLDVLDVLSSLPATHRLVQPVYAPDGSTERLPVVTEKALISFLLACPQTPVQTYVRDTLAAGFRAHSGAAASTSGATRWGEQPFRELVRVHSLSMSEFTSLLNKHVPAGDRRITQASVSAVAMGRQLPNQRLLSAMVAVLQAPPSELLTPDALAAYERKGLPREVRLNPKNPPRTAPEPVIPVVDESFDMDAEAAKMDAAFAELGFSAGFTAVTGADASPSAPSSSEPPGQDNVE